MVWPFTLLGNDRAVSPATRPVGVPDFATVRPDKTGLHHKVEFAVYPCLRLVWQPHPATLAARTDPECERACLRPTSDATAMTKSPHVVRQPVYASGAFAAEDAPAGNGDMTTTEPRGRSGRPGIGQHYERLDDLQERFRPVPAFPTNIRHVALDRQVPKPRPCLDGHLHWCCCCNTLLPQGTRSALCTACRTERKRLRQAAARDRDREEVTLTRRQVAHIHENVDALIADLGALTVKYNMGRAADLRDELNDAMIASKGLIAALHEHLPRLV